jgi:ABC-type glycerol-3-phosphate transport system substrate-binding protein
MRDSLSRVPYAIILALFLTACSSFGLIGTATIQPATIVFVVPDQLREFYASRAEDFKTQQPNLTIDIKSYQVAGSERDVSLVRFSDQPSRTLQSMDNAIDLTPFIQEDEQFHRDDFYPGVLDAFTRNGKLVGLPISIDPFVLYYNKTIFDQNKIPYPTSGMSWDNFKTLAMQLRDPALSIYGYAPFDNYTDSIFFAFQHGATLIDGTQVRLNSREAIEAVEWYTTLFNDDAAPTASKIKDLYGERGIIPGVVQGQIAMWIWPLSSLQSFPNPQSTENFGVVSLPRDVTTFSVSQFDGVVISKDTKSPDACWLWINYLTRQAVSWAVPARRSVATSPEYASSMGKDRAAAAIAAVQDAQLISNYDMAAMQKVIGPFLNAVTRSVEGRVPPAETLSDAQQEATQ